MATPLRNGNTTPYIKAFDTGTYAARWVDRGASYGGAFEVDPLVSRNTSEHETWRETGVCANWRQAVVDRIGDALTDDVYSADNFLVVY